MRTVARALISVSDKDGVLDLARSLRALGVELLSTGGTGDLLRRNGVDVTDVSQHTGFPEAMDGRLKTLHPRIHGGLLGRPGVDDEIMHELGIERIDLLVVNLYPFGATVARPDCTLAEAVENIDIGGPAMIRAAAKNHAAVAVVVDPQDYPRIITAIKSGDGSIGRALRFELAAKAFAHTAAYDTAIANYLRPLRDEPPPEPFPARLLLSATRAASLRYGENPHQQAAFYRLDGSVGSCIASAEQVQGKAMSYNNIADADAALECVRQFEAPACVIVKHANPCGVAVAADDAGGVGEAYRRAHAADPTSAFGGIVAVNRPLDGATAARILETQFVEVLVAPGADDEARRALSARPSVRLLVTEAGAAPYEAPMELRSVGGGLLAQQPDRVVVDRTDLRCVTARAPGEAQLDDLLFAWKVVRFVKSNAIVLAKDGCTIGIGAGQTSRVDSARIAVTRAADHGFAVGGSVMASDAFFPFRDGLDHAASHGVAAVVQPGGSKRDPEVIAAADEHGIAMVFTGARHFRH